VELKWERGDNVVFPLWKKGKK